MLGGKWELVIRPKLANEEPPLRKLTGPLPFTNPELLANKPVVECPPGDPNV